MKKMILAGVLCSLLLLSFASAEGLVATSKRTGDVKADREYSSATTPSDKSSPSSIALDSPFGVRRHLLDDDEESCGLFNVICKLINAIGFIWGLLFGSADEETLSPTLSPTVTPSLEPSGEAIVTAKPTDTPTLNPTMQPIEQPTDAPTPSPITGQPTDTPTFNPTITARPITSSPTSTPTSTPTTEQPTDTPTFNPTITARPTTSSPTSTPTTVQPTDAPSSLPTLLCSDVELDISCENCAALTSPPVPCVERPSQFSFRYTGSTCDASDNIQSNVFVCMDLNGGPSEEEGMFARVAATDRTGSDTVFDDLVEPGDIMIFRVPPGSRFPADLVVTVFDVGGLVVQELVFSTSCVPPLFLTDRFGSIQLVSFENTEQGLVTVFQDALLKFTITDVGMSDSVTIRAITYIVSPGDQRFESDELDGNTLQPLGSVEASIILPIDLTNVVDYVIGSFVDAEVGVLLCSLTDTFEFTAGILVPLP